VTVTLPHPALINSIKATGMRLDVNPVAPLTKDSHEVKWEITAQGEGSGLLLVEAPSELDPVGYKYSV
jgi:hypothetical protein